MRLGQDGGREPASQGPRELETQKMVSEHSLAGTLISAGTFSDF